MCVCARSIGRGDAGAAEADVVGALNCLLLNCCCCCAPEQKKLQDMTDEFNTSEEHVKALQSIGQIIAEVRAASAERRRACLGADGVVLRRC